MDPSRNDRSLRNNLKDLLQGYLEHCEFSRHLMARIDFPIIYHGFRFGAPVFTHTGPAATDGNREIIGLIGLNSPGSNISSEVLLQFIEILSQEPGLAGTTVLRVLPVADPVALELGGDAPPTGSWPILDHLTDRFREESADGIIEIGTSADSEYRLEGDAPSSLFDTLRNIREGLTATETRPRLLYPEKILLNPVSPDAKWRLKIHLPAHWHGAPEIHAVSRFIARLIRLHSKRHRAPENGHRNFL